MPSARAANFYNGILQVCVLLLFLLAWSAHLSTADLPYSLLSLYACLVSRCGFIYAPMPFFHAQVMMFGCAYAIVAPIILPCCFFFFLTGNVQLAWLAYGRQARPAVHSHVSLPAVQEAMHG